MISAGNFHGEYPAKVLDYLAIGIHEMASMSERRIERLVNPGTVPLPFYIYPETQMLYFYLSVQNFIKETRGRWRCRLKTH